jgi:predicted dehydrogenase
LQPGPRLKAASLERTEQPNGPESQEKIMSDQDANKQTRRTFIKSSAAAAGLHLTAATARSLARASGANGRLHVGVIGTGRRGRDALMKEFHQFEKDQNAEIVATCDTWKDSRDKAAKLTEEWYGKAAPQLVCHRELLGIKEIDAVIVATPDHSHSRIFREAAESGRDVYCEKPVAMTMDELNKTYDAVKKNKRITQLGTQLRSWPSFTGCKALYESGVLGKVTKIEQSRNGSSPYWFGYASREVNEKDVDWKRFLFHLPHHPFTADRYAGWYGYRDYSSGPIGNLLVHFIDLVHRITGAKYPASAVCHGGVMCYKDDGRDCPDNIQALLEYPEGFLVSYNSHFGNSSGTRTHFYGMEGMMDLTNWRKPTATASGAHKPGKLGKEVTPVKHVDHDHHMLNWLKCVRTRQPANACMLTAGYSHGVAVILADSAWVEGRKMIFDPGKREIRPA